MAKLQDFRQLASEFAEVAEFAFIYVEEAHPSDGWYFKVSILSCFVWFTCLDIKLGNICDSNHTYKNNLQNDYSPKDNVS